LVNDPQPVVVISPPEGDPKPSAIVDGGIIKVSLGGVERSLVFYGEGARLRISMDLKPWDHVLGLGEKALPLEGSRRPWPSYS
jgi:alpha-glucosidase